jgi:hypothetical protein
MSYKDMWRTFIALSKRILTSERGDFGISEAAMLATAVGAGVSAVGQIKAGESAEAWGNYNAAVARNNALAATQSAEYEATKKTEEGRQLMAKQRVAYAMSGVDTEGSPTDVILGTAGDVKMDAMAILRQGAIQAGQYESQAVLSTMQAESAMPAAYVGAGSTLLTGLGRAASYKIPTYQST